MRTNLLLAVLLIGFMACQTTKQDAAYTGESFGAGLSESPAPISYEQLADRLAQTPQDTLDAQVIAEVESVCQMKGCWMTLLPEKAAAEDADNMMVRFKDYGFFMPKDIAGRRVIVEGRAYLTTTSVEDLRHYAKDAGKPADEIAAITEPRQELAFLASGVLLLSEPAR